MSFAAYGRESYRLRACVVPPSGVSFTAYGRGLYRLFEKSYHFGPPWVTMWGPRGGVITCVSSFTHFCLIWGVLFDVIFEVFHTVGGSDAAINLEVVSRGRFV